MYNHHKDLIICLIYYTEKTTNGMDEWMKQHLSEEDYKTYKDTSFSPAIFISSTP